MQKLLLPLLALLALEITGLVFVGIAAGAFTVIWYTLVMVFIGLNVARKQGARLGQTWQQTMASGRPPEASFFGDMMVVAAGLCFAFPGLLTDVLGLCLLIPALRNRIAKRVMASAGKHAANMMANGGLPGMGQFRPGGASPFAGAGGFGNVGGPSRAGGMSPFDMLLGRGFGATQAGANTSAGLGKAAKIVDAQATVTPTNDKS